MLSSLPETGRRRRRRDHRKAGNGIGMNVVSDANSHGPLCCAAKPIGDGTA
jgi:hypothetical protein